ncbi:FAD-dependent oxidoreductase [Ferrimicrobium sp.]|uniref:NAD(P)/FAD-dependent oxidoreductase n=1 Tax=Ferrimicrobium sp. TaxID=2926050 RepID=UPI0026123CF3|nr:FAD-dependent oxidoreductase [Ferrimicrobium sp.]
MKRAVVIGAGMVGLACGWHLQERGYEVTILERGADVAEGSSWGNAGWLSPALAIPLNEPSLVTSGLLSLVRSDSPLYVPLRLDPELWRFLALFASQCTAGAFREMMDKLAILNARALEAFDALSPAVEEPTVSAPILAGFRDRREAEGLLGEFELIQSAGGELHYDLIEGKAAQDRSPLFSPAIGCVIDIHDQRYLNPNRYTHALADSLRARGATFMMEKEVTQLRGTGREVQVRTRDAVEPIRADVAVVATGAWANRLARGLGVRIPVRAGRGYSMICDTQEPATTPIYLPTVRVACTPIDGGLRVAGTMEFRRPDDPLDPQRLEAITRSTRDLLAGIDIDHAHDRWVGPRPVSADGLPLIGPTTQPGVYLAAGHGMWGVTQGPITGQLLAQAIDSGEVPPELRPFDPLRAMQWPQVPRIAKWPRLGSKS